MQNTSYFLVINENGKIAIEKVVKDKITIGRSPSDDIILLSKGVSRCHATVYFSENRFWIIDGSLKGRTSTNGLFVNKERVSVHQLNSSDLITLQKGVDVLFLSEASSVDAGKNFENTVKNLFSFVMKEKAEELFPPPKKLEMTSVILKKDPFVDELTGLANRQAFFPRVRRALEFQNKIKSNYKFAILFIDLDRFKMINDSMGHMIGDKLLTQIGKKLSACLRDGDVIARLGGDEFAILLNGLDSHDEAVAIAQRLQKSLALPITIDKHELYPSISIGIALSSLNYQTVEDILRDADIAMYQAKNTGKSKFIVFDKEMHQKAAEMLRLDGELRKAIERQQLKLFYQPIVSLADKKLVGFEALLRWIHPELGFVSPEIFIPIAEDNNLIYEIGQWALEEACRQLAIWKKTTACSSVLSMNVNLSSKQLMDAHLIERIRETLAKYQLAPGELKLEITESIIMENIEYAVEIFKQLKELGVHLAIDDFGTGYSSLNYLNKFPIDTLKVDRSFIGQLDNDDQNTNLNVTNSIISLAHSLGVRVVAEGIERIYHLAWLRQQRCDYGQGFLFSKPLDVEKSTALLQKGLEWKWKC